MTRPKLRVALPIFNLLLAAFLLAIGYGRVTPGGLRPPVLELNIAFWLNAPAVIIQNIVEVIFRKLDWILNGVYPPPIVFLFVFLIAVAAIWFYVGLRIDEKVTNTTPSRSQRIVWRVLIDAFFVCLGVVTLSGLFDPRAPHFRDGTLIGIIHDLLYVAWALLFLGTFGVDLVRSVFGSKGRVL